MQVGLIALQTPSTFCTFQGMGGEETPQLRKEASAVERPDIVTRNITGLFPPTRTNKTTGGSLANKSKQMCKKIVQDDPGSVNPGMQRRLEMRNSVSEKHLGSRLNEKSHLVMPVRKPWRTI